MPQVASTLSSDVKYTLWRPKSKDAPGGVNTVQAQVVIHGGHGVAVRHDHGGLITPQGVLTSVTTDQLELLHSNEIFQTHLKNGFIRIIESDRKVASETVAKDLEGTEPSSPLTDTDFKEGGRAEAPKEMKLSLGKGKSK